MQFYYFKTVVFTVATSPINQSSLLGVGRCDRISTSATSQTFNQVSYRFSRFFLQFSAALQHRMPQAFAPNARRFSLATARDVWFTVGAAAEPSATRRGARLVISVQPLRGFRNPDESEEVRVLRAFLIDARRPLEIQPSLADGHRFFRLSIVTPDPVRARQHTYTYMRVCTHTRARAR